MAKAAVERTRPFIPRYGNCASPSTDDQSGRLVILRGHGDSLTLDHAFSDEVLFAVGMNGETLSRTYGFPLRPLAPRYYGFKNVKWIDEMAFVSKPHFGTWPQMGHRKEPLLHTASFIDRYEIEARAVDGTGCRQDAQEGPMFPTGVAGPTIRRVSGAGGKSWVSILTCT